MRPEPAKRRRSRTKPCSICKRWFLPNPRVGARQRTCGQAVCKREQKRRSQRRWSDKNPEYWIERRLADQSERLTQESAAGGLIGPKGAKLPRKWAQDAIGAQGLVIMLNLARLWRRQAQVEMNSYLREFINQSDLHRAQLAQDATDTRGPASLA